MKAYRLDKKGFILAMALLSALAPFSTDTYLPAMSKMAEDLSVNSQAIQLTLTSFFVAFAFGQLLYGPLSERYGRKKPLYGGLALFILASVGCAYTGSAGWLIFWRFMQALGASAGGVVARAMITDKYDTKETVAVYSSIMIVMGLAPMVAPLLGGYMINYFEWRAIFWLLASIGVMAFALLLWLPETSKGSEGKHLFKPYLELCRNSNFMFYTLIGGVSMGGMFSYISEAPFLYVEHFGLSGSGFAWLFALNALAFVATSKLNLILLKKATAERLVGQSLLAQAVIALALLFEGLWLGDTLVGLSLMLFAFMGTLGFIIANSTALALENLPVNASYASALMGAVQFFIAGIASAGVSMIGLSGSLDLAVVIAIGAGLGCVIFLACVPRGANRLRSVPTPSGS